MNFISKMTGKSGEASKSIAPNSGAAAEASSVPAVRVKAYTGLEIKTLWNHFNKDDLLTISEVGELLDRVLIKDASDIYGVLKGGKGWKDYCSAALKLMDTSQGSTIDLQEFNSEFNAFYVSRLYYGVKYLVPQIHIELLKACQIGGLDAKRLAELESIIKSDGPAKVVMSDKSVELAEIARLNALVASLTLQLEAAKTSEGALEAKLVESSELSHELSARTEEIAKLQAEKKSLEEMKESMKRENLELKSEIKKGKEDQTRMSEELASVRDELRRTNASKDQLNSKSENLTDEIQALRVGKREIEDQFNSKASRLTEEIQALRGQLRNALDEVQESRQKCEAALAAKDGKLTLLEIELRRLREKTLEDAEEWKSRFQDIIDENTKCKAVVSDIRTEIIKTNSAILENLMQRSPKNQPSEKISSLHAAALSGSSLDPFRTELVHQFGSLEAVMGKRKKLTLHELETVATSIGYTREYSKKLFYALDSRNRGFLTADQFSRPLPMLNDDLCLLTKAPS